MNTLRHRLAYRLTLIAAAAILVTSCADDNEPAAPVAQNPSAVIAVFSDPHYFDPDLGNSGTAFDTYVSRDRKMIAESHALTQAAVAGILASDAQIVLVSGDLTKDGEKSSHERFAGYLAQLEQAGKAVFVVPGNHDVRNPNAMKYVGDDAVPVPGVTAQEFAQIYGAFGYDEAIARDPASLTYVAEPVGGIWIVGMDVCRYQENDGKGYPVTGGRFLPETERWIKARLQEAKDQGKTVFGVMHHGMLEHFQGQKLNPVSADYVVDDWARISSEFAGLGMHVVFTGHFHSNDIVSRTSGGSFIYDIETGSLVTWPSPWRLVRLQADRTLEVATRHIETIQYDTQGKAFQDYAFEYLSSGMQDLVASILQSMFGLGEAEAQSYAPIMAAAFIEHYRGDEQMSQEARELIAELQHSGDANSLLMAAAMQALLTDLPPADNAVTIDLETGEVR